MKTLFSLLLLLLVVSTPVLLAQTTVDAREIIAKIDRKQPVSYQNVTITGDLDLTELANKEARNENWGQQSFVSTVTVPLTFTKCVFKGHVIAYKAPRDGKRWNNNTVYTANFDEAVRFEQCEFVGDAAFKYSKFREVAVFTGDRFGEEALFKYTKFAGNADFTGSTFRGYANFKYTDFSEGSGFHNVEFSDYADFKYTEFRDGADFSNARFGRVADFKYVRFPRGTNFTSTRFEGTTDFKYATRQGQRFTPER